MIEPGSFRDPSGRVYVSNGRVFRTVMPCAASDFQYVESTGLLPLLEGEGLLVRSERVDRQVLGETGASAAFVIEHPRLPFISYPYEWSFSLLKAAGVAYLDVHMRALEYGVTLSDASAYNVQFVGPNPIFIDRLSFRRYVDGEFWGAHRQFCEQFLNPLLLRSIFGVPHNPWYRGNPEGIPGEHLSRFFSWRRKLSWRILKHIVLPASFQKMTGTEVLADQAKSLQRQKLPLSSLQRMLRDLRAWIQALEPADPAKSVWAEYSGTHGYSSEEVRRKRDFVTEFIRSVKPAIVWDLGCNTGDYAARALDAGAHLVIGFDCDHAALELAFARAGEDRLAFLPLFLDAGNPPPNQGWAESERRGLQARASADAVLALAFTHHLAIRRNIPLPDLVGWLVRLAPQGVVEFVPKSDPMVQQMLSLRTDIFPDYSEEAFLTSIEASARIVAAQPGSASGRRLIRYSRK
jgi:ribosomal protein L11 methylase PrmA